MPAEGWEHPWSAPSALRCRASAEGGNDDPLGRRPRPLRRPAARDVERGIAQRRRPALVDYRDEPRHDRRRVAVCSCPAAASTAELALSLLLFGAADRLQPVPRPDLSSRRTRAG